MAQAAGVGQELLVKSQCRFFRAGGLYPASPETGTKNNPLFNRQPKETIANIPPRHGEGSFWNRLGRDPPGEVIRVHHLDIKAIVRATRRGVEARPQRGPRESGVAQAAARGIASLIIGANCPVMRFHENRPLHRLFDCRSIEAAHDADLKPFKLANGAGAQLDFEVESLAGYGGPRRTHHQTIPRRRRNVARTDDR